MEEKKQNKLYSSPQAELFIWTTADVITFSGNGSGLDQIESGEGENWDW